MVAYERSRGNAVEGIDGRVVAVVVVGNGAKEKKKKRNENI